MLDTPRRLFYRSSLPHSRLHAAYKAYLLNGGSSILHILVNPPCIFALKILPVTTLAKLYGIDQSALIQECYPFLKSYILKKPISPLSPPIFLGHNDRVKEMPFITQFSQYIITTNPFKQYLQNRKLEEDSKIALVGKCLQLLSAGNNHDDECGEVITALARPKSGNLLKENADNVLLYIAALKTRPLESRNKFSSGQDPYIGYTLKMIAGEVCLLLECAPPIRHVLISLVLLAQL